MRKTKEVLRLRFELGLGQWQIARQLRDGAGHGPRLSGTGGGGIGGPLPEGWSEEELEAKLFVQQPVQSKPGQQRPQPDWKTIHEQLQQHRHLTLQLVWEEYRQAHPAGYRYSWFCERYQHWRRHVDVVLRQEHKGARRCSWTGRGQRSPCMTPRPGKRGRHRCLFPCWGLVPTLTRKLPAISNCKPGFRRTSTRWNFS